MKIEFLEAWYYKDSQRMQTFIAEMKEGQAKEVAINLSLFEQNEDPELLKEWFRLFLIEFESKVENINYQTVLLYALSNISFRSLNISDHTRIDQIFSNLNHSKILKHFRALYYIHKCTNDLIDLNINSYLNWGKKAEECMPIGCERWYKFVTKKLLHSILYKKSLNTEASIKKLEEYPQFKHLTFDPKYLLARYLELTGNPYKALKILLPLYKQSQNSPYFENYFSSLIKVYGVIGDFDSANQETEKFLLIKPNFLKTVKGRIFLAEKARAQNEPSAIKKYIKDLLRENTGFVTREWALYLLLSAELLDGAASAARRILLTLDPLGNKSEFYSEWVRLFLLEGDESNALTYFKKILEENEPYIYKFTFAFELRNYQFLRLLYRINNEEKNPNKSKNKIESMEKIKNEIDFEGFIGKSQIIEYIKENIIKFGALEIPVIITGETGTGKEEVARLLHLNSSRAKEPFIPVNCGGISSTLIESELFGYKKGAFTGAEKDHQGLFVAAGSGTIFLDEISSMPIELQSTLLRVLENMKVRPVGSTEYYDIKARVIVATNIKLDFLLEEGKFRQDLYFRLNRLQINLPALRDRKEDIPLLSIYFLKKYFPDKSIQLEEDLVERMKNYSWPGNVRELKHELERMAISTNQESFIANETVVFKGNDFKIKNENLTLKIPKHNSIEQIQNLNLSNGYEKARINKLIELFKERKHLTRAMAVRSLGCAPNTAAADLKKLEKDGFIKRALSTASDRSSYYYIIES